MLPVTFASRSVVPVCSRGDLGCIELGVLGIFLVYFTGDFILILVWQMWAARSLTIGPMNVLELRVGRVQMGFLSPKLHATAGGEGPPIVLRVGGQRGRLRAALQLAGQEPIAAGVTTG